MRSALFVSTLLATALIGGTALAERTGDESTPKAHVTNARELKERIVHESTDKHETPAAKQQMEKAPAKIESARPKGDLYDHYGQKPTTAPTQVAAPVTATTKAPAKLLPGRAHGDVIDPVGKKTSASAPNGIQTTVGSTQMTWTAGGKNVRSFVHFTNDKGQTNNNIHGATASSEKMRLCAKILMGTAGAGLFHTFSWQTAGGDNQSLFPGD